MKKDNLKENLKIICNKSVDYNGAFDPREVLDLYNSLDQEDKNIFVDLIIENLDDYYIGRLALYIKSDKIFNHIIQDFDNAIENNDYSKLKPRHFAVLLCYEASEDTKRIILFLMNNLNKITLSPSIKWDPLQVLSKKYPDLIEKYLPNIKEIYHCYGNSMIIDTYSGLINFHKTNFPEVFVRIAKGLTEKEINRVFKNLPIIFSNKKLDDIKEEIYKNLEKHLNVSIERKITL